MSCAARYSETTSLKFILNPFEIFRTVKIAPDVPSKLSIIERLEHAWQRLTIIFPLVQISDRDCAPSHISCTCRPDSSGNGLAAIQCAAPRLRQFIDRFSPRHVHCAEFGAVRYTQRYFIKRISTASVHTRLLRTVSPQPSKHDSADVVRAHQGHFFPVLRVDLASVGDLPRIRRQSEPAPTALASVVVFPRQKTHDVRTHSEHDACDRFPGLRPAVA